jgi:hypothetical protein
MHFEQWRTIREQSKYVSSALCMHKCVNAHVHRNAGSTPTNVAVQTDPHERKHASFCNVHETGIYKFHRRICGGTIVVTARYSVFLLSLTTAHELYHTESLHPPRHPVRAAVFRTAIKDTPSNTRFTSCVPSYFLCANRHSSFLFAMLLQSASWVIPISHMTTILSPLPFSYWIKLFLCNLTPLNSPFCDVFFMCS